MTVTTWYPGVVVAALELSPAIVAAIEDALSPAQTMAITAAAEARSSLLHGHWIHNPARAMIDILGVIDNRRKAPRWHARGHKGVCLQHGTTRSGRVVYQFSCWQADGGADSHHDPRHLADNFEWVMEQSQRLIAGTCLDSDVLHCEAAAEGCLAGALIDDLYGATHYYATWMPSPPAWAVGLMPVVERYGHRFFRNVA